VGGTHILGMIMEVEVKRVDSQGRVSLPPDWRRDVLGENPEVYVLRDGENLVLKPKRRPDLTAYFDSVTAEVDPEAFRDPHKLRRALLEA
jgi:DNA-binding transcriptional regulator/RsmH inhibitor MraZ